MALIEYSYSSKAVNITLNWHNYPLLSATDEIKFDELF